ncbi:hypothetical protein GGS24DRAFT_447505 [Hypoxylon argillaceum]|nr:hypothetical protein GGS24DRAFT_447505 [Hypoxylon argillaceum]
MAVGNSAPRSVADATRFTSSTPHANTKSTAGGASSSSARSPPNVSSSSSQALPRRAGGAGVGSMPPQETMDERVRRLRAAHLAAKQHDVSRMDKVIEGSRRLFDAAHKFTVMGLIAFSGISLLVTIYATADMMMHNRKRRAEFFALQKQMREDSLEAARLAYIRGTASEEQIALVEDATARAKDAGTSLPPLLSVPQRAAPPGGWETPAAAAATTSSPAATSTADHTPEETKKGGGITAWLFGGLKKEDVRDDADLSASDDRWRTTTSSAVATASAAADNVTDSLRGTAKAAFEQERDNQRRGGPLDQIGQDTASTTPTAATTSGEGKKKGWLW